jgi:hypothetical protein
MDHSGCNQHVCVLGDDAYCPGPVGTAQPQVISERSDVLSRKEAAIDALVALETREAARVLEDSFPEVARVSISFEWEGRWLVSADERFVLRDGSVMDPDDVQQPFEQIAPFISQETRLHLWVRDQREPGAGTLTIESGRR